VDDGRGLTDGFVSTRRFFVLLWLSTLVGVVEELRVLSVPLRTSGVVVLLFTSLVLELRVGVDVFPRLIDALTGLPDNDRVVDGDRWLLLDKTPRIRVLDFRTSTELRCFADVIA
jgi:hypothetical protein